MGRNTADVTVHIDETLDHAALQEVVDHLRGIGGVGSVTAHDDKPHLMIVQYDPDRTDSSAIHQAITAKGIHAELIGL